MFGRIDFWFGVEEGLKEFDDYLMRFVRLTEDGKAGLEIDRRRGRFEGVIQILEKSFFRIRRCYVAPISARTSEDEARTHKGSISTRRRERSISSSSKCRSKSKVQYSNLPISSSNPARRVPVHYSATNPTQGTAQESPRESFASSTRCFEISAQ